MAYIGDILNQIRLDKHSKPEEYVIVYFDRLDEQTYEVPLTALGRRGNFIVVAKHGKAYNVPLHRIRQIKHKGKVIWEH